MGRSRLTHLTVGHHVQNLCGMYAEAMRFNMPFCQTDLPKEFGPGGPLEGHESEHHLKMVDLHRYMRFPHHGGCAGCAPVDYVAPGRPQKPVWQGMSSELGDSGPYHDAMGRRLFRAEVHDKAGVEALGAFEGIFNKSIVAQLRGFMRFIECPVRESGVEGGLMLNAAIHIRRGDSDGEHRFMSVYSFVPVAVEMHRILPEATIHVFSEGRLADFKPLTDLGYVKVLLAHDESLSKNGLGALGVHSCLANSRLLAISPSQFSTTAAIISGAEHLWIWNQTFSYAGMKRIDMSWLMSALLSTAAQEIHRAPVYTIEQGKRRGRREPLASGPLTSMN